MRDPADEPRYDPVDALTELVNIGMGKAAGILNDITRTRITLHVPRIQVMGSDELSLEFDQDRGSPLDMVVIGFTGGLEGSSALIFPPQSAQNLVSLITGDEFDSEDFDSLRIATLTEVGNIVLNHVLGSITNCIGTRVSYSLPEFIEVPLPAFFASAGARGPEELLLARTRFGIEHYAIEGTIVLIMDSRSLETLLESIEKMAGGL